MIITVPAHLVFVFIDHRLAVRTTLPIEGGWWGGFIFPPPPILLWTTKRFKLLVG